MGCPKCGSNRTVMCCGHTTFRDDVFDVKMGLPSPHKPHSVCLDCGYNGEPLGT
jgi:hypothetical protein